MKGSEFSEFFDDMISSNELTPEEYEDCLKIDFSNLTEEDGQIFVGCMKDLGIDLSKIRSVSYSDNLHSSDDYDGGYVVHFSDGSTKEYGWYDSDSSRGKYAVYEVTASMISCAENTLDSSVRLEIEYEPYERYGSSGIRKIRVKGSDLYHALCKMCDKMCLYLYSDVIEEDEMDAQDILQSIEESNGDGCDYIFYIKNLSTGEMLLEGDYTEDEYYDDEEDYDE